ncbi:hypothetical protein NDU88_007902 [Pleurodeles waltl]|uniref:Uncharacterized protein n=1 Tax=Pleurodeles waltl TaxID=8319 RepID=A0AAV7VU78_PLEWA|nr:hypothetical protein NDU88_007902 [Pleurodeles waltl]
MVWGGDVGDGNLGSGDPLLSTRTSEGVTLQNMLQAITDSGEACETKINTLVTDLGVLCDYHKCLVERVTTSERDTSDLTPALTSANEPLTNLEVKVQTLEIRAEDAENRTSWNIISIV